MSKATVKLDDVIVLDIPASHVWIKMTEEEVQALRDADKKASRWHDDGGEPILYGTYTSCPREFTRLSVKVTQLRPRWEGYNRRPKNLRGGFCFELKREVLFQAV